MILLLLVLVLLSSLSAATLWFVRLDGYGHTPPPRPWPLDQRLPGGPYGI